MTVDWIGIAGVAATIVIGVAGWFFASKKTDRRQIQKVGQKGKAIQSGRDTRIER